ncbi:MAG: PCP reductase family protein [Gemmatimonadetes bacterium]|nr:PCP reductase family protein [Gemmatimonadota bacterium]
MKFLCVPCDEVMTFADRQVPGDGTLAAVFGCPGCGREMAMLTNPYETQMVSSLGVKIGGRTVPEQPMELVRTTLEGGGEAAFVEEDAPAGAGAPAPPGPVTWSPEAADRLTRVPSFVRGMVKRIYADWARERGLGEITPEVMDRARTDLGLEGM